MKYTSLDNSEIADYLRYHEETHFARDCRKIINLTPKQLRAMPEREFGAWLLKIFSTGENNAANGSKCSQMGLPKVA